MLKGKLTRASVEDILQQIKQDHAKRYGEKMRKDYKGYEPKRKTYSMEDLANDLRLILYFTDVELEPSNDGKK